jgi:DivIVA domain-containing protein
VATVNVEMFLGPIDIAGRRFNQAALGYDTGEVERFLGDIAKQTQELLDHVRMTDGSAEHAHQGGGAAEEAAYSRLAREFSDAVRAADVSIGKMRREAEAEVDQVLATAQAEAERLSAEAKTEADQILAAAREEAHRLQASAKSEAERLFSAARAKVESSMEAVRLEAARLLTAARVEADRITRGAAPGPALVPPPESSPAVSWRPEAIWSDNGNDEAHRKAGAAGETDPDPESPQDPDTFDLWSDGP